ncbi:hypothetical protein [Streptomyces sp. NPDC050988]|uniref:hypothetical protein n=1 Tax=Streptomyces sp. NPDC050988 TaxID=3365637 RepID=UPI0037BCD3A7
MRGPFVRTRTDDERGYVLLCAYSAVSSGFGSFRGIGSFRGFGARVVVVDGPWLHRHGSPRR